MLHWMLASLIALILISGFFSGSETSMMALNRYRLQHLVKKNNRPAQRVSKLLERPDRLLGVILIGNTFANILASAVTTLLAIQIFGEYAVLPASILVALLVLIFSEVMPKTIAALYPERLVFPASSILLVLLKIFYPLVWMTNTLSNGCLRLFGIKVNKRTVDLLTRDEIKTVLYEATGQLLVDDKTMMMGILDLGGKTVDDIKVPRQDIRAINLDNPWLQILEQLSTSHHTRLPVYRDNIDNVVGVLHLRKALHLAAIGKLSPNTLLTVMEDVYFIPETTPLNVQLVNFQQKRKRIGLVVDEYGDIKGLLTLDDILEEIVGEYTTSFAANYKSLELQKDGSYLVDGSVSILDVNRQLAINLPIDGPKTLSGLVIEYLEMIPPAAVSLRIADYPMDVIKVGENTIKLLKIWPHVKGEKSA